MWVYAVDPHATGIIWRKIDTTLVLERYFRSMFGKRAGRKLVAQIAERKRGWIVIFEAYLTLEELIEEGLRWPQHGPCGGDSS